MIFTFMTMWCIIATSQVTKRTANIIWNFYFTCTDCQYEKNATHAYPWKKQNHVFMFSSTEKCTYSFLYICRFSGQKEEVSSISLTFTGILCKNQSATLTQIALRLEEHSSCKWGSRLKEHSAKWGYRWLHATSSTANRLFCVRILRHFCKYMT